MRDIKLKIPFLLLIFYIIFGLFLQYTGTSEFRSLPSPIYGGDYYYQMGSVNHILSGGNPFESSSMLGGIPGYLPLYGMLCAGFCKIFGLDAFHGMIYFSLVIFTLGSFIWYFTFKKIFENEWISVIGVVLANGISVYPILKYTPFTKEIMIPLFIFSLYLAYTNKKMINYGFLGVIYGLLAISHTVAFVGATLIIATFVIYEIYKKYELDKIKGIKEYLKENWKNLGVFTVFGIPISLLYWYKPVFAYKLHQVNNLLVWNVGRDWFDLKVQINFLFEIMRSYLFNFGSLNATITSVLVLVGIYQIYKLEKNIEKNFLKVFGRGCIFATFSYILTIPLLSMHFVPDYMASYYLSALSILLILFGLKNTIKTSFYDLKSNFPFMIVFIVFLVFSSNSFTDHIENDQWAQSGKNQFPTYYGSLQDYLLENTNVEDTILSTKELSFAVNSFSGRKLVVNRWAQQNDPYMDMSERDIDAALILYGNNTEKKLELIEKYNIKYIYWDYYWINSEYKFDTNGNIAGIYDPMIAFYSEDSEKKLVENGVKYSVMDWWVDPSMHDTKKFNLIIISPENYKNAEQPWNYNLDEYLEEVWSYSDNGKKISVLYKIKRD